MSEANIQNDDMLDEYDFSQAVRGNPDQPLTHSKVRVETSDGDRKVSIKTVEVQATVDSDGKVTIQLPPDITPGKHYMTLLIQEG
ncbi:MAG: hypothetical protein HC879_12300 [Leptolyngbyaceae cyanobacterium SL_5_9]|nr:hypothetical protein [Leptolyngbyaceae cyanobacterium SL_5_9]NJO72347.1 hypothetical protein [Leptolyngbyaceae cyanobacterium RM1_406_9]